MKAVLGIDVGGSTTKIVGFDEERRLIEPMFVRGSDQITSIYGAFGKFTDENGIALSDVKGIKVTGVGASFLDKGIYSLRCDKVSEFESIGRGGLYLSGLERGLIVSLGTGTACVYADKLGACEYLGGTGIGGGTLMGLSRLLLGMDNIKHIYELAEEGDLGRVDLKIKHITRKDDFSAMQPELTVANFGKLSDLAEKGDLALGILNMVFEAVGTTAKFAARTKGLSDIVLIGNLTNIPQAKRIFDGIGEMLDVNFIIPEHSQFGTVIGAALTDSELMAGQAQK